MTTKRKLFDDPEETPKRQTRSSNKPPTISDSKADKGNAAREDRPKRQCRNSRNIDSDSESLISVHEDSTSLKKVIYLDLRSPTAIVMKDLSADNTADEDEDLKIHMKKLLGLAEPMRLLLNPNVDEVQNLLSSELLRISNLVLPPAKTSLSGKKRLHELINGINSVIIEKQTPQHIKEHIDILGLPEEQERSRYCHRQHSKILDCLKQPQCYSFVESLSMERPAGLCHPLALTYRERKFQSCRKELAKTLFNMFNHVIFYCGLPLRLAWKRRPLNQPSSCELSIDRGGKRVFLIVLSQSINLATVLVKVLLHEMCHAAAFVFNGETGHGDACRKWAFRSKTLMPELPVIEDCVASYKYICNLCRASAPGNAKFQNKVELRCNYCQFDVAVADNDVHIFPSSQWLDTRFKSYVREQYLKLPEQSHTIKMRQLNASYAQLN